jgi:hypothetical protein
MTEPSLTFDQLTALLSTVFAPAAGEGALTILIDLPDDRVPDHDAWRDRRRIAGEWFRLLHDGADRLPFDAVLLCACANAGSNNNDLPADVVVARTPAELERLPDGSVEPLADVLHVTGVLLALTELSATAPLKVLAREHGFRGASMPGFSRAMIPVLALDYEQVNARVVEFRERLDRASGAVIVLEAGGRQYRSFLDLRFRTGHASGGLMRERGAVGNLPSGEAYIVPYEGERDGEASRTSGELPVQFGDDIVVYRLDNNRAVEVHGSSAAADDERRRLLDEPAYGNIAELGIGVLGEWGVTGIGSTLLDEKLGLHIAFGRSDHFGGVTGPSSFRKRDNVVHIDRVYVESTQPLIVVREVTLVYDDDEREPIIVDGGYVV